MQIIIYLLLLWANEGTKSLNLLHPLLILVITLSTAPLLAPIVSTRKQNVSTISREWPFNSVPGQSSTDLHMSDILIFTLAIHFQFPSNTLHLLCTQHLQNWQSMEVLSLSFIHQHKETCLTLMASSVSLTNAKSSV